MVTAAPASEPQADTVRLGISPHPRHRAVPLELGEAVVRALGHLDRQGATRVVVPA